MQSRLLPGGPTPSGLDASAAGGPAAAAGREEPEAATDVGRRRDSQRPVLRASEGRRWWGARAVDNLPDCERAGQGKEEGTQETRPQETWRKGLHPEVGQKGIPGQWGHEKSQGPTKQHSCGKIQGIEDKTGPTGERRCQFTYPFKNSHQNLLD